VTANIHELFRSFIDSLWPANHSCTQLPLNHHCRGNNYVPEIYIGVVIYSEWRDRELEVKRDKDDKCNSRRGLEAAPPE
jgi:hypothetical protein